jgi:20S proteasome alpha/beta subunit
VTVCIATIFSWNYAADGQAPQWGQAILTASDRQITAGDIQYEPQQQKILFLRHNVLILIAGDYALNTQALKDVKEQAQSRHSVKAYDIAKAYGVAVQALQRRAAEDEILAPLGLNTDTFLAQQKDMSDAFIDRITNQLQSFQGADVQALIVGVEPNSANVYAVDFRGNVGCFDDVGFTAIGIGSWHSRSMLMQSGYVNWRQLPEALASIYAAKKAAEVAPGVGTHTDINIVLREGTVSIAATWPHVYNKLNEIYSQFLKRREALSTQSVQELHEFLRTTRPDGTKISVEQAVAEIADTTKAADDSGGGEAL